MKSLLSDEDILTILPTGFGKSVTFTLFVLAMQELKKRTDENTSICVLVISPLQSIIDDQIAEMLSLNCACTAKGPCLR